MKKLLFFFIPALLSAAIFTSCSSDDDNNLNTKSNNTFGSYIINYGNLGKLSSSITRFDYKANTITNSYFEQQNNNFELLSNIQYANSYNNAIYMMGNSRDEIITTNHLFEQTQDGISEGIEKPRYFVASGDYLYVSCWGSDADFNIMANSFIAVVDIKTNKVVEKINLAGGAEALAIVNGNLYAALNYKKQVAVIDLNDYTSISYIETPGVTSYFLQDKNNNLYVTLLPSYTLATEATGLGYINTSTNTLEATYVLDGISTGYSSIIAADNSFSSIYVIASTYVKNSEGNWEPQGSIYNFDTETKKYSPFAEDLTGINAVSVNPETDEIYALFNYGATNPGILRIYKKDGTSVKDIEVGSAPAWTIFLN